MSEDGVWRLSDIVGEIDPVTRDAALVKNDMAFLIEDLLSDPRTRLAATLLCTATLSQRGSLRIAPDSDDWAHLEPHRLLDGLRPYLQMGSG